MTMRTQNCHWTRMRRRRRRASAATAAATAPAALASAAALPLSFSPVVHWPRPPRCPALPRAVPPAQIASAVAAGIAVVRPLQQATTGDAEAEEAAEGGNVSKKKEGQALMDIFFPMSLVFPAPFSVYFWRGPSTLPLLAQCKPYQPSRSPRNLTVLGSKKCYADLTNSHHTPPLPASPQELAPHPPSARLAAPRPPLRAPAGRVARRPPAACGRTLAPPAGSGGGAPRPGGGPCGGGPHGGDDAQFMRRGRVSRALRDPRR